MVREHLPEEFQGASYRWQLSSSAGLRDDKTLSVHLDYWLDLPRGEAELTRWAKVRAPTVDPAPFRTVQPLYTAAPGTGQKRADCINKDDIDAGRIHFRMDGKAVFEGGVTMMSKAILDAFEANKISFDDLDMLIPHQANLRMLEAIVKNVNAPEDKVFTNVDKLGNMASACLPVALDQARKAGKVNDGDLVLLVAFGSGFVWASALMRM